jgi:hypothetical protein
MAFNFSMGEDERNVYPLIMLEVSIPLTTFYWHIRFERCLVMYLLSWLHLDLDLHGLSCGVRFFGQCSYPAMACLKMVLGVLHCLANVVGHVLRLRQPVKEAYRLACSRLELI